MAATTLDALARDVKATAPDPLVARYANLRPSERVKAVLRARNADGAATSAP